LARTWRKEGKILKIVAAISGIILALRGLYLCKDVVVVDRG
jgi:hypothetical protein